jgi:hypothetical protein
MTVIGGWSHATTYSDVNAAAGEVNLTERLRDGMRKLVKAPDHPWGKALVILPGTESRSSEETVVPDGRTDIPLLLIEVFLQTQEHEPHAIIECKRIAGSNTHLCREYVVEGMDRFRSGKYGGNHAIGFMVGYVLTGTDKQAADGINAYLTNAGRMTDTLEVIPATNSAWRSRHDRTKGSAINLLHALLSFAVPQGR